MQGTPQDLLLPFLLILAGFVLCIAWLAWAVRGKRGVDLTVSGFGMNVSIKTGDPSPPEGAIVKEVK